MNRLTNYKQGRRREPSKKLVETKYMPCSKCDYIYCDECVFQIHTNRLASYEDTGLEPEQIDELNKMLLNDQIKHGRALDKLLEYQKLEKQGLLIKLPCKVGSTVYRILYDRNIENSKVESFEFSEEGIFVRVSYESPIAYITSSYPIEDLFLTREEAEKALEVENESI